MNSTHQPFVSIVTPVYNGERYLASCIESALAQTYKNFEYIIVNNCSTDRTLEVAQSYARKDRRIRIHNNTECISVIPNHNIARQQMSVTSKYCKMLHADDELFPECLERMVEIAEKNPNVGIVGSYILFGNDMSNEVRCVGIPYSTNVMSGKEVCRSTFRGKYYVFGPPSVTLIRSDLIRDTKDFYDEELLYADIEACFRVSVECGFGFVHQILSRIRLHERSQSSMYGEEYNKHILEFLCMLKKYGPRVFNDEEFEEVFKWRLKVYYRFLGKNILLLRKNDFWKYHINGLKKIGYSLSVSKLLIGLCSEVIHMLFNFQESIDRGHEFAKKMRSKFGVTLDKLKAL